MAAELDPAADQVDNRDHDDGAQQGHQHGRKVDRVVDRSDMKDGTEKVTGQEGRA
jgi:hypothetical protein